jgi:hypothetical protein
MNKIVSVVTDGEIGRVKDKRIRQFLAQKVSSKKSDNLPDPDVLAQEIVEDLEAALEQFRETAGDLGVHNSGDSIHNCNSEPFSNFNLRSSRGGIQWSG